MATTDISSLTLADAEARAARHRPPLGTGLLYRLARWAHRRSAVHRPADLQRTTCEVAYRAWRARELRAQLGDHFDTRLIAGKAVLDFACGTGELCALIAEHEPRSLLGMDMGAEAIRQAEASVAHAADSDRLRARFVRNEPGDALPLRDQSVDLICCFDALEHIIDARAVASQWRRILRPGGRIWIWWSPWRGPYGHHLESLIPLPWVHLVIGEKTLFAACAELYDAPDFVPRKWDRDPATGQKRPNKWRHTDRFHPFLNRMTRGHFERIVRDTGLTVLRRETHGFSGSWLRRTTRRLLPIPLLGECFVSFYVYELTRA